MNILWWQILLLTLYAGYQILDELQIYSSLRQCLQVFCRISDGILKQDLLLVEVCN